MDDLTWQIIGSSEPVAAPSPRQAPSWPRADLERLDRVMIQQSAKCAMPLAGSPRLRINLASWTPDHIYSMCCVAGDDEAWVVSCYEAHQASQGDANAIGNLLRGGISSACAGSWALATPLVQFLADAPEAEVATHGRAQRGSLSCETRDIGNGANLLVFSNTHYAIHTPDISEALVFPLMPTEDMVARSRGGAPSAPADQT